jgi:hypothetical protein
MKWQYVQYWVQKGDYGLERIRRADIRKKKRKQTSGMCKCGHRKREALQECPFDREMSWSGPYRMCRCCSECRHNCAMDV